MTSQNSSQLNLFATTPKGLELLLVDELRSLGATNPAEKLAGVTFTGNLELAYKACLWSRLANRILLRLATFPAKTPEELYAGVQSIAWDQHLEKNGSLAVNFTTTQSEITHTLFGAQKVKDAIVDQFRDKYDERPNVEREQPDVNINVYIYRDLATISIDLSGDSLHKRGYRLAGGSAPLKENLAAAILIRAGWPAIAKDGGTLADPMCGSGTLLIEGALMAGDMAPGLSRNYFGFYGWKKHQAAIWEKLVDEAVEREAAGILTLPSIVGYDANPEAITNAFENIERAGLMGKIHVEKRELASFEPKLNGKVGLVVTNPPYGERLGEVEELQSLYTCLGDRLKKACSGWKAAVFTGNPDLGKVMGLRAKKFYALFNGALPCKLLLFDVDPIKFIDRSPATTNERRIQDAQKALEGKDTTAVTMFINRLQKNLKHIKRWAEREGITCYRVYDADLPEYAFSIDIYEQHVYVQEYHAPKTVDPYKALERQQELLASLPEALAIPASQIFFRVNYRRVKTFAENATLNFSDLYTVHEGQAKFLINLRAEAYETGLNLQQRSLRALIQTLATRSHFLSLFDYAGVMTVSAALGGASSTKTVLENLPCVEWAKRNLLLNGIEGRKHEVIQAEHSLWLDREKDRYHLIYADIPEMEDYELLVYQLLKLLLPDGTLILTAADKRFKLEAEAFPEFTIEEITQRLIPEDFSRHTRMQKCWKIS